MTQSEAFTHAYRAFPELPKPNIGNQLLLTDDDVWIVYHDSMDNEVLITDGVECYRYLITERRSCP